MKVVVISYSLTGNNEALAGSIATELGAEHIRISENKRRKMLSIFLDILFDRTPRVQLQLDRVLHSDLVVFVGPVWLGHVSTPFRVCFKRLRATKCQYAFVSISGGADGENVKLAGELNKRMGKEPAALIDLHIADLLPAIPKPTRKDTMVYRLTKSDIALLTVKAVKAIRECVQRM